MFFDFKIRSMRKIKTLKKRLSNVHHQNKMCNMWKASWCSKQELSHTSTRNEEDEIDKSRRNFILFCQADADVDQIRCHALFIISRSSFLIQQCRKRRTSRVSERFSERFSERLSEQNLTFKINIIKINITINIIRINFVRSRCDFRRRHRFRCRFRLRCCFRFHTILDDSFHDFVSAAELTDNDDANERTKSTNCHSLQRRRAARLINHETQAQADRHVLKRKLIHELSTRIEQKSRQTHEASSDYSNRNNSSQKSENSSRIDRISDFSEFRDETFRTRQRVVCKQTRLLSIRSRRFNQ